MIEYMYVKQGWAREGRVWERLVGKQPLEKRSKVNLLLKVQTLCTTFLAIHEAVLGQPLWRQLPLGQLPWGQVPGGLLPCRTIIPLGQLPSANYPQGPIPPENIYPGGQLPLRTTTPVLGI